MASELRDLERRLDPLAEGYERFPEAVYTVEWMIARSEKAAALYRRLEQMADDAGFVDRDRNWAVEALEVNRELDRLLATLEEWRDAEDEIQLDEPREYAFQHLVAVCRARIARSDGEERERLERLRRRLLAAARRVSRVQDPEEELSELQGALRSLRDPTAALATVREAQRPPAAVGRRNRPWNHPRCRPSTTWPVCLRPRPAAIVTPGPGRPLAG